MKKFLLILCLAVTLPALAAEGLSTTEYALQTGELMGMAQACGVSTGDADEQFILSIRVLATYRKEQTEPAVNAYRSSVQRYSASSNYDCSQVQSDFAQVQAQLQKSLKK